jgi:hypothetical protein
MPPLGHATADESGKVERAQSAHSTLGGRIFRRDVSVEVMNRHNREMRTESLPQPAQHFGIAVRKDQPQRSCRPDTACRVNGDGGLRLSARRYFSETRAGPSYSGC